MTIKLVVVTGYLGSGKTTLLRALKTVLPPEKCHFIVNEAGQVALDQATYELVEDKTSVVAGGCACCVRKDALLEAIKKVVDARDKIAYIIVETSGLANPAPIIFSIKSDPYLYHHVTVAGVVCVLGSVEANDTLARYDEVAEQLAMADAIVLSKTDLVAQEQLQALEAKVAPMAKHCPRFFSGAKATAWPDILATLENRHPVDGPGVRDPHGNGPAHPSPAYPQHANMTSCVLRFEPALDWVVFGIWLSALLATHGESIVRVKGVIRVADWANERFYVLINGVQHIVYPPQHIKDTEALPETSALVFILKNIAPETLVDSLSRFHNAHVDNARVGNADAGEPVRVWRE